MFRWFKLMTGSLHMERTLSKIEQITKSNSERETRRFKVSTCKIDGEKVRVAKGHT